MLSDFRRTIVLLRPMERGGCQRFAAAIAAQRSEQRIASRRQCQFPRSCPNPSFAMAGRVRRVFANIHSRNRRRCLRICSIYDGQLSVFADFDLLADARSSFGLCRGGGSLVEYTYQSPTVGRRAPAVSRASDWIFDVGGIRSPGLANPPGLRR